MSDNSDEEDFRAKLQRMKPKKKKMAVPKEFLEGANSYDAKLAAIKIIADREKPKVMLILKQLLKPVPPKVEEPPPPPKKPEPPKKKKLFGK